MKKGEKGVIPRIIQKENPLLRAKAAEVDFDKIDYKKLSALIQDMQTALDSQDDGVAIAAPQIGQSVQIFVVSKRIFEIIAKDKGQETDKAKKLDDMVFINPKILKLSKEKNLVEEGCLSVRWLYGKVSRSKKTTIEAYTVDGKKFTMGASGLLAQIFQHETDHLHGVLFTDKAVDLEEIPPEISNDKIQVSNQ